MQPPLTNRLVSAAIGLAIATTAVLAGEPDRKPSTASGLPGVEGGYSIVTPVPEPRDAQAGEGDTIKAGHWELTISGYVWVQVGASSDKRR